MQRDVKIGIAIGVLLIALIAIFWWAKRSSKPTTGPTEQREGGEATLPPPVEPVAPVAGVPAATVAGSPAAPSGTVPGAALPTAPVAAASTSTVPGAAIPAVPTVPTGPAAKQTYKIQSGDNLASISKKFYGTEAKWQLIANANKDKIPVPTQLRPGVEIVIPDAGAATPPPSTGADTGPKPPKPAAASEQKKYTVGKGDTLTSIARKFYGSPSKAKVDLIYHANEKVIGPNPNDLKEGTVLVIPADK